MHTEVLSVAQLGDHDLAAWERLHESQRGPANPFTSPEWSTTWYRHFAPDADAQLLLAVREGEQLVGIAPFFRGDLRVKGLLLARRLQLAGAGQGGSLLELPQVLCAPGCEREVLRSVVEWLRDTDDPRAAGSWTELTVADGQGWFEPQWIDHGTDRSAFFRHQRARACVVLELDGSWEQTLRGLKRNVKESLRRSRNRLARHGGEVEVRQLCEDIDVAAVDRFLGLHRARADLSGTAVHPDAFADPVRRRMMRELLPALGRAGRARLWELHLGGEVVAVQLVLHAPQTLYVHSSGMRADVWELGAVTHLQEHAFRAACEQGDRWVNLSPGPNLAKRRWSERISVHDDFAVGVGSRSLLWRYALYAAGQALTEVRHTDAMARRG
ncbi:GNAT family N-acetyltransferase [Auraticoccus sp. F435]|uniref:GNAT family N-acetyltransferase n=1 Tax=Auraticoccus cholistanensis TaxID=2656650 RepID=A0A6A9UZ67_9ACTN|nr:GNAT family N-acetyltransferase [Auraticoccus cholistanensis]MVA77272.1 GNAT family N-acetyltransferase [Auraticoccus cholistanensis]